MRTLALTSLLIILLAFLTSDISIAGGSAIHDVFEYGAKGDGKTLDTVAIQKAIDTCHVKGGGQVTLHDGIFLSGTLILRDHVSLSIASGATLKASDDLDDFPTLPSKHLSYTGDPVTNKMLIYAEDAKHISITGRGTIDGNGDHWVEGPYGSPSFSLRPRILHMRGCDDVLISDVTLHNSASWVQSYQSCTNLQIRGIKVDSRENKDIEAERYATARGRNTDGLDLIDCQNVTISDCIILSGDDGIVLKSYSPSGLNQNFTITNCVISTNSSGIKIGTETAGIFDNITVSNCAIYDTRGDAIAIESADGAQIERVIVSNIVVRNLKGSAIFVRLGNRNRLYRKDATPNRPHLKDIMIDGLIATRVSGEYACSVSGIPDLPVENITVRNVHVEFEGGGESTDADREIPQQEKHYPSGKMFGRTPAYGFYLRNARALTLENIRMSFLKKEERPAIYCDNIRDVSIRNLKAAVSPEAHGMLCVKNSQFMVISESAPLAPTPTFLSILGTSDRIILRNNDFTKVMQAFTASPEVNTNVVKEIENWSWK